MHGVTDVTSRGSHVGSGRSVIALDQYVAVRRRPSTSPSDSTSPSTSPSDSTSPVDIVARRRPEPEPEHLASAVALRFDVRLSDAHVGSQVPSTVTRRSVASTARSSPAQNGLLWNGPADPRHSRQSKGVAAPKFTVALTPQNPTPGQKVTVTVSYDVGNGAGPFAHSGQRHQAPRGCPVERLAHQSSNRDQRGASAVPREPYQPELACALEADGRHIHDAVVR